MGMVMVVDKVAVMVTVPMMVVIRMCRSHSAKGANCQGNRHDNGARRSQPQDHDTVSSLRSVTALLTTDDQDDLQSAQK
jgi:hypothetical protein